MKYIIIGGTSGIGLATASLAVKAGHQVIVAGRDEKKFEAARLAGATPASLDATDMAAARQFFAQAGFVDHLILCASGSAGSGAFRDLDLAELRRGFDGKFWPQVICAQSVLPYMVSGGSITFISAISSRAIQPGTSGLAAINASLEALIPVLASELRPIRVNAVVPGVVDTPWWSRVPEPARKELFNQLASQVAAGRVGQPEDIAKAIIFLTTNTFITGTILDVDGGWKLKNP